MAGFGEASNYIRLVFALFVIATACGIIGISSPAWLRIGDSKMNSLRDAYRFSESNTVLTDVSEWNGIYDKCVEAKRYTNSNTLTVLCKPMDAFPGWIGAVRCFSILGLISMALAGCLVLVYVCHEPLMYNREIAVAIIVSFFFSCISFVVAIGTYGGKYNETNELANLTGDAVLDLKLNWAFGLTIGAAGLAFLAAIFSIPELQYTNDRYSDYEEKRVTRRHGPPAERYRYPERQGSFGQGDRAFEMNKQGYAREAAPRPSYRY